MATTTIEHKGLTYVIYWADRDINGYDLLKLEELEKSETATGLYKLLEEWIDAVDGPEDDFDVWNIPVVLIPEVIGNHPSFRTPEKPIGHAADRPDTRRRAFTSDIDPAAGVPNVRRVSDTPTTE